MASTTDDATTDPQQRLNHAIATADVTEIVRLLEDANQLDLDRKDVGHDLQTPLMRLCHMRTSAEVLDTVLERLEVCAWNPNVQDAVGRTLLMHGCISDRVNVVLLCLENGCNVDLTDRDGNSALVYAVKNGSPELVRLFLDMEECRVLLARANNLGQTPLDIATQDGQDSLVTMLTECMPDHRNHNHHHHHHHSQLRLSGLPNTLTPGSTLAPPTPLSPRTPATGRRGLEEEQLRRTISDNGKSLELQALFNASQDGGSDRNQVLTSRKEGDPKELAMLVSGRLSKASKKLQEQNYFQLHHQHTNTTNNNNNNNKINPDLHHQSTLILESSSHDPSPATTIVTLPGMTSHREVSLISEASEKSPRRSKRNRNKQRLLRREKEDITAEEDETGTGNNTPRAAKPQLKELVRSKKDSVSLPDLRDFKGKLVTSGDVTPAGSDKVSSEQSQKSSGRKGDVFEDEDPTPTESYLERYKNSDLSASCSLPPLQSSSADSAERRKERGGAKLVHGRKNNSTEEVMLRSLIV